MSVQLEKDELEAVLREMLAPLSRLAFAQRRARSKSASLHKASDVLAKTTAARKSDPPIAISLSITYLGAGRLHNTRSLLAALDTSGLNEKNTQLHFIALSQLSMASLAGWAQWALPTLGAAHDAREALERKMSGRELRALEHELRRLEHELRGLKYSMPDDARVATDDAHTALADACAALYKVHMALANAREMPERDKALASVRWALEKSLSASQPALPDVLLRLAAASLAEDQLGNARWALEKALETARAQCVGLPALPSVLLRLAAASLAERQLDDAHWALEKALETARAQCVGLPALPLLLSALSYACQDYKPCWAAWAAESAVQEAERLGSPYLFLSLLAQCAARFLQGQDAGRVLQRAKYTAWSLLNASRLAEHLGTLDRISQQQLSSEEAVKALRSAERDMLRDALDTHAGELCFFTQACLYRLLGQTARSPRQVIYLSKAFLDVCSANIPGDMIYPFVLGTVIRQLESCALYSPAWHACLGLAYLARSEMMGNNSRDAQVAAYCLQKAAVLKAPEVSLAWGKARLLLGGKDEARRAFAQALSSALPGSLVHEQSLIELGALDTGDDLTNVDDTIQRLSSGNQATAERQCLLGRAYLARHQAGGEADDLNKAITTLERAERITGDSSPERAPILASLGRAYLAAYKRSGQGEQLDLAINYLEQSPLREDVPDVLNDLGEALLCLFERNGRPEVLAGAMAYLQRALALAPPGLPLRAAVLNNLGRAYLARHERLGYKADLESADYAFFEALQTEEAYEAALMTEEVYEAALTAREIPRTEETALPRSIYSIVYRLTRAQLLLRRFQRMGQETDLDSAIRYLEEALALAQSKPVKDVPRSSQVGWNWSSLKQLQPNEVVPAIQNNLGEAYLARHQARGDSDDLEAARKQLEAAKAAICPDKIKREIEALSQNIEALSSSFSEDSLQFSEQPPALLPAILNNLGKAYLRTQNLDSALAHLYVARALCPSTFHPERADILNHLGLTWQALGDSKRAIEAWQEGQDALRYIISIEPEVQILAGLNAQITRRLVSAHLQQNDAAAALSALERGRTIRLRAEQVRAGYVLNKGQDDQLARDYRELAEIAAERRLLFYDYVSNRRRLDQQTAELVKKYEEISKKIITAESAHPDASLSADQIKAHVEEHQITLIVLCPLDETDGDPSATLALIVTPKQGLSCHKLPLTRQQLHKLIFDKDGTSPGWLPAYQASFAGDEQIWQDTIDRVLGALGESLLAPLHDVLVRELNVAEGSAVVIVPCEHLSLLPLHAAPVKDDGPCFGDVFVVSYAPSATMLFARAGKQQADAQTDSQFVAVVNPDGSLICAEGEVEKIPTNLAGKRVVAYGADARLKWLLDHATQADYLHLSTHGDFASGWPERSALLLAHPEGYTEPLRQAGLKGAHLSRAELQDGCEALTLNDLWAYRLKVKPGCLVVLSACETGQIEPGDMIDEALGFPTALLAAGARGVVASLWAVDDFSTSLLMQKMYEEVASGKPPAAAMQVASKYLRNLDQDQIHKEVEGQIQKLEEDYKSGRWKELGLSDQARMFYRITTLKIIFQRTQNCNLTFSKSYYWAPFLYYHLL